MKAFSLEEYIKNPSRKLITRDGRKVTKVLCTNAKGRFPIVALVESFDGENETAIPYTNSGHLFDGEEYSPDLFFAPEKHEGWLNIYRSDECGFYMRGKSPYTSKEEADVVAKANPKTFFTTIKVEWDE